MIEAVIFDMDGLMFDTESTMFVGMKEIGNREGIDIPDSVIQNMIGCDSRMIKQFEEEYPGISRCMELYQQERLDFFFRMNPTPGSGNMKGLEELVVYLNEEEIPYAIASSSAPEDIRRLIEHADCHIHPKEIVSSKEDGIPSKPDPTIFKVAAERLGSEPDDTLVLEDSKHGVMATRKAGMRSIYIPDKVEVDRQMYPYVHTTCTDLSEVIDIIRKSREK